jgi:hypothetical protein
MRLRSVRMSSSVHPPDGAPAAWNFMRSLAERVRTLQSVEVEHLMAFHNPKIGGFVVDPQHQDRGVSVLSTCNVVRAMVSAYL